MAGGPAQSSREEIIAACKGQLQRLDQDFAHWEAQARRIGQLSDDHDSRRDRDIETIWCGEFQHGCCQATRIGTA